MRRTQQVLLGNHKMSATNAFAPSAPPLPSPSTSSSGYESDTSDASAQYLEQGAPEDGNSSELVEVWERRLLVGAAILAAVAGAALVASWALSQGAGTDA